jgi:hypothetical protein
VKHFHFEGAIPVRFNLIPVFAIAYRRAVAITVSTGLLLATASIPAPPMFAQSASLAGIYDGGQMEIAAGLELKPDGRFRYMLSYGALDEEAAGKWAMSGDRVLLTSDPVRAARFVLVSRGKGDDGLLQVHLDVPKGVSRQHFSAEITKANGQTERKQFAENGLSWPFRSDNAPTSIRLLFAVFGVTSKPLNLDPNSGYAVRFRFEPNDLGKADFRATPLKIINGELLLDRHGRTIRFKRPPARSLIALSKIGRSSNMASTQRQ